jgi:uncharacterized protein
MPDPGPREAAKIVQLAGGEIIGSTRLQKIGCLLELVGAGVGFDYSYHLFGPYSEELSIAAADADALDLIDIKERTATWGGRYSIYRSLSDNTDSSDPSVGALAKAAAAANSVALELAVTAAFLAKNGYSNPWEEVAARKSAKATAEMMSQAKSLYRDLRRLSVPVSLPAI